MERCCEPREPYVRIANDAHGRSRVPLPRRLCAARRDFIALEPVTHETDAFNRSATRHHEHRFPHAAARRGLFLYDAHCRRAARLTAPSRSVPDDCHQSVHLRARRAREPRRMSALVRARAGVLYWVDINAPSLNRFDPASGRNVAMPMPASIGSFALRAARRLRRRAARRHLARRRRRHARAQGRAAAVRSGASPLQRRPLRSAGPLRRRFDEREARRGRRRRSIGSIADFRLTRAVRRHHDQQRSRVEPGRPHDVSRGHACAHGSRIRLRRAIRHAGERRDVRAMDTAKPSAPTAAPSTAPAITGCAFYRGGKVVQLSPRGELARRIPGARDVPDDVRVRRPRPPHALRDDRAAAARRRRARALAAERRHLLDARRRARPARSARSAADAA